MGRLGWLCQFKFDGNDQLGGVFMKLSKDDYAKKIAVATPVQLVAVNYELILDFLTDAETAADDDAYYYNVEKARGYLNLLAGALDLNYAVAGQLLTVYLYLNRLFITRMMKKDRTALADAKRILTVLYEAFLKIQNSDAADDHASKLFAGLTYNNKGELDEYFDDCQHTEYRA
jgi:flagellar protein FliS